MKSRVAAALLGGFLLAGCAMVSADDARYLIESEIWVDGEARAVAPVVVESGEEQVVETTGGDGGWRISYEVEPPGRGEGAGSGAIWVVVGLHEMVDGRWEFVTDTMLGVRVGGTGVVSVVDEGVDDPTPETARMYLRVGVQRLERETH